MIYQKFIPEGWNETEIDNFDFETDKSKVFQGIVKRFDEKNNLFVKFGANNGIIPSDQIEGLYLDSDGNIKTKVVRNKLNKYVQFKVMDIDENGNYVLSRKVVQKEALNWFENETKKGDIIEGIVTNIRPYGAFVEVGGGVVGLLHIEDMSISRIKSPEERFKVGDHINVMIKSINDDKIELTYKELLGTWDDNIKEFEEKKTYNGIVRNCDSNKKGIFIELKPNLVGMAEYAENIEYGKDVSVYIKKIDYDKKKIKLIIKDNN